MTRNSHDHRPLGTRSGARGGIALGTTILTLEGELPVEYLTPGDRIITRGGARTLRRITPHHVTEGLYRVCAHTLGGDRPEAELHLAAGTGIAIRDWRAQAMYGTKVAVVAIERLADGVYIAPITGETTVFTLEFDQSEVIYVEGLEIICAPITVDA